MKSLTTDNISALLTPHESHKEDLCVSIYFAAASAQSPQQRMLGFKKLLREANNRLSEYFPQKKVKKFLDPISFYSSMEKTFVNAQGIACFSSAKIAGILPLEFPVNDLVVIANSFHIKPIISLLTQHNLDNGNEYQKIIEQILSSKLPYDTPETLLQAIKDDKVQYLGANLKDNLWGLIDWNQLNVTYSGKTKENVDCIIDDIAEEALRKNIPIVQLNMKFPNPNFPLIAI